MCFAGTIFVQGRGAVCQDNGKRKNQECRWLIVVTLGSVIMDLIYSSKQEIMRFSLVQLLQREMVSCGCPLLLGSEDIQIC